MNLTTDNYFSKEMQAKYMSVSQFKAFEKCQAAAMAEITGEYEPQMTISLLVGSYVDAYFDNSIDAFKAKYPKIFRQTDGVLKSDYRHANEIIQRIERDTLFMEFLSGKKQVIMTGELEGIPIKIKIDALHPDKIVDLKIVKDFAPMYVPEQGRVSFIEGWRYDLQGAVYQEIVRQNTGKALPFYIAAATKEAVPDIDIIEIPQELLAYELGKFKEKLKLYDYIKKGVVEPERCERCDYCKATKQLTSPKSLEEFSE